MKLGSMAKPPRGSTNRRAILAGALGSAALVGSKGAIAQGYPSKLITIVMPYAAGGSTDVIARVIADKLRPLLDVPVIVENKPGAGGAVGSTAVARAEPNGYTLLLTPSGAIAIAPLAMKPPPFDAIKDFTPVAALHKYQLFLYARSDGGYRSMDELIAAHKAGKSISMAITGNGNSTHYCAFWLGKDLGIDFVNVPYSSGSQVAASILKGEVDVGFLPVADLQSQISSGAVRMLLVASKNRSAAFPAVPSVSQFGLKEPEIDVWIGLFGPRGLPEDIVAKLSGAMSEIYRSGALDKYLEASEKMSGTPSELATTLASDVAKYRRFIDAAGFLRDQK
jgi:tripartite-type tricarboxylate transporter receptor subunit TctC